MFGKEDNTFNELREKSIVQWLDQMSGHDEIAVRGGVKVTKDFIGDLQRKIASLENENELKDKYLKKLSQKNK